MTSEASPRDPCVPAPATVTVLGAAAVTGVPDVVVLSLAVQAVGVDIGRALDASNRGTEALVELLTGRGVAAVDIATSAISLGEHYDHEGRPDGHQVYQGLRVVLRDLAGAGQVMTDAVVAGGSGVRIEQVGFEIADEQPLLAQARAAAMVDAQVRAGQYAQAAGLRVGRVLSIAEASAGGAVAAPYEHARKAFTAGAVPLNPGGQQVQAQVAVTYALLGPERVAAD